MDLAEFRARFPVTRTRASLFSDVGIERFGAIGAVRVDPHAFNDEDDIDRFLACCDAFTPAAVASATPE